MNEEEAVQTLFTDGDDLRTEFVNLREAYGEHTVITPDGERFHRVAHCDEGEVYPQCVESHTWDWRLIPTDNALQARFSPCRDCYEPILDYLASCDDSDVERTEESTAPSLTEPADLAADGGLASIAVESKAKRLGSPTEEVLIVKGGGTTPYHAPTPEGPLCGLTTETRRVDREVLAGHSPPCQDCFDLG